MKDLFQNSNWLIETVDTDNKQRQPPQSFSIANHSGYMGLRLTASSTREGVAVLGGDEFQIVFRIRRCGVWE